MSGIGLVKDVRRIWGVFSSVYDALAKWLFAGVPAL